MSEKKIKLYDELRLRFSNHKLNNKLDLDSHQFNSHDMIEFAGAIGFKILELAAENAALNTPTNDWQSRWIEKKSIKDTIKQVE